MSDYLEGKALQTLLYGRKVERATANLPATAVQSIFTVVGGRVAIKMLMGTVTTIIQDQACNLSVQSTPTVGVAHVFGTALEIRTFAAGRKLGIGGAIGALESTGSTLPMPARDLVVSAGTIQIETSATNTGAIAWSIMYVPIDDGAYVTAA
jgi:hypothetical protein